MGGVLVGYPQADAPDQPRPVQLGEHPVVGVEQFAGRVQQPLAKGRQTYRLVVTIKQAATGDRLQTLDMHTDRCRALVQQLGCRFEATTARHCMEGADQLDVEYGIHRSIIPNH